MQYKEPNMVLYVGIESMEKNLDTQSDLFPKKTESRCIAN